MYGGCGIMALSGKTVVMLFGITLVASLMAIVGNYSNMHQAQQNVADSCVQLKSAIITMKQTMQENYQAVTQYDTDSYNNAVAHYNRDCIGK
jgi:hypothetical protein